MMKYALDEKNILFKSENDIRSICKPVFNKFNLQYFSYGKFYDDGRCILLSTNKNIFVNHFKKEYKLTVPPEDSHKNKIYNLILVNNDSPDIIADEYNLFQHGTMIDLIKKGESFYEMFCYVSKDNSFQPANEFLNHLELIDSFSEDFLNNSKDILQEAQRQMIQLPESMRADIKSIGNKFNQNRNILLDCIIVKLSERQYQCLSLLSIGKTSKEIANSLNLSYRTVETHIELLKLKLGCKKRSDLTMIALENNLNKSALSLVKKL